MIVLWLAFLAAGCVTFGVFLERGRQSGAGLYDSPAHLLDLLADIRAQVAALPATIGLVPQDIGWAPKPAPVD